MYCKYCGKQLPDGCRFCAHCGGDLRAAPQPAQVVPPVPPVQPQVPQPQPPVQKQPEPKLPQPPVQKQPEPKLPQPPVQKQPEPKKPEPPAQPQMPKAPVTEPPKPVVPLSPVTSAPPPAPRQGNSGSGGKKPKGTALWIILCSVVAAAVLGVVAFFLLRPERPASSSNENYPVNTAPTLPENPSPADQYYFNNSEVIGVIDAASSSEMLTEAQAKALLEERGFTDFPVTFDYSADGTYIGETEILEASADKHPMYQTFYTSANGDLWVIYIINGSVFANPVAYNLASESGVQTLMSESDNLTSYDDATNKFFVTKPYETAIIVKNIGPINAATLDNYTMEAIDQ